MVVVLVQRYIKRIINTKAEHKKGLKTFTK